MIDDGAADPFARGAGLTALALLWNRGVLAREEILGQLLRVASLLKPESDNDVLVSNAIVDNAIKVNAHEIRGSVLGLYERGLADETFCEFEYTAKYLLPGGTPASDEASLNRTIDDAWAELRHWAYFNEKTTSGATDPRQSEQENLLFPRDLPYNPLALQSNDGADVFDPAQPFRAAPRIGRNEPCRCGSGKKFKKCCGQ